MNLRLYQLLRTLINVVLSLVTFFLVSRIVLRFFSTNPQTPVVAWITNISSFLMAPFANIVPNLSTQFGVLDTVAIITLLAYLIIGYLVLSFIEGLIVSEDEIIESDGYTSAHYHDLPRRRFKRDYPRV